MKHIFTLLLLGCSYFAVAAPSTYQSLAGINRYWLAQEDVQQDRLPEYKERTDKEWIRLHLSLVEQTLRNRSMTGLSAQQQQRRKQTLDYLHDYWMAGNFPLNEQYSYRRPIFIDKHDNFCAVGYLVKATGHEAVSRMIASRTNLAYVMDMQYAELDAWAKDYGFTKEELAWIQPTYAPDYRITSLGKGVNGIVKELFVDNAEERLYVGGFFSQADETIDASNIAYLTKEGTAYQWHNMGNGINGQVFAICEFEGKIFAGGAFSMAGTSNVNNVAYWENGNWYAAGCLSGSVQDLVVFNGALYAAGAFDICSGVTGINFAKWNGLGWTPIYGLSGQVNTMEIVENRLLLGGYFTYQASQVNAIAWNAAMGFMPFASDAVNSVNDFAVFNGRVYAGCNRLNVTNNNLLLLQLENDEWKPVSKTGEADTFWPWPVNGQMTINTLLAEENTLLAGGLFESTEDMTMIKNCADVTPAPYAGEQKYFLTNGAISKMIWFKGDLIAGGSFQIAGIDDTIIVSRGIGRRVSRITGIEEADKDFTLRIYPNPLSNDRLLTIENEGKADRILFMDISGRIIFRGQLRADKKEQQVQLPALVPGLYLVELGNSKGEKAVQKLVVR